MTTTKTVNYTNEQVSAMRKEYESAKTQEAREAVVSALATQFKKSKRSIISKMSREGFYKPKQTVSKVTGEKPAKKDDLANTLRFVSGLPMVSAEKLNKTDIQDLITHFEKLNGLDSEMVESDA